MSSSIYDFLYEYENQDIYPFHMPGHKKNKSFFHADPSQKLGFLQMDITEIPGADNLHHPQEIIKNAQMKIAHAYGSDESFMLVNGSSCGIIAAILSVCQDNDQILLARNSHRSAYSGLVLSGARPLYVYPEMTPYGIPGGISPLSIQKLLRANQDVKAVFITSPTYEGFCSDIEEIARIVHAHHKILIVDEAHGAHFGFHEAFPLSALHFGADIVIHSAHKTLPALTQSSFLHVKGSRVNRGLLRNFLAMVQTSSPSYLLMAMMETCMERIMDPLDDCMTSYINRLHILRESLCNTSHIKLISEAVSGKYGIKNVDISKQVFSMCETEMTGVQLERILRTDYKIQIETSCLNHAIALTSVADSEEGFQRLSYAIMDLDKSLMFLHKTDTINSYDISVVNSLKPRDAVYGKKINSPLLACNGKVSADFIIPYPPGIPLLAPGEVVSAEAIRILLAYLSDGIEVLGVTRLDNNVFEMYVLVM